MPTLPPLSLGTRARHLAMGLFALMFLSVCVVIVCAFLTQQQRQKILDMPAGKAQILGARFIVGYDDPAELIQLAKRGLIAGIFVTQRKVKNKSAEDLRHEIAQMQDVRRAAGLPQLIVTTDQEGGAVSRLSPPLPRQTPLSSLLDAGAAQHSPESGAFDYGVEQGRSLAYLGVNVNFSPVVDIKSRRGVSPFDFFSQINSRAISADPALVADIATAYSLGLASVGVLATVKHFPGLGEVAADTHLFSAQLNTSLRTLEQRDWLPFRQVLGQTDALMMLAHVTLPGLDAAYPASLSKKVVQGIIRQSWRHEGVLITDDLSMRAAQKYGSCGATVAALNAGVDLLLLSYEYDRFYSAMQCAADALSAGHLDAALLTSSGQRLARLNRHLAAMTVR